jgi:hypothetical protein
VSDGNLLVDDQPVDLTVIDGRRGRCHLELYLTDGTKVIADGASFRFQINSMGKVFEQWTGPIRTS